MKPVEHVKDNKMIYTIVTAATMVLTGAGVAVENPFTAGLEEIRLEIAQNYERREEQHQYQLEINRQNDALHDKKNIQDIEQQMKYVANELERLRRIPGYLGRERNEQEVWELEYKKTEWKLLQEELYRLKK